MQGVNAEIVELPPERTAHIRNHFPKPFSKAPSGIDLPYGLLGGDGFERLCALLLIADGQAPRYFGKRGDTDYGVDVIVSDGASCVVYQCKNVATYKKGDLAGWLDKFATAWLIERPHLPKPEKYVLVCPLDLREKDDIECAKTKFRKDYEVLVEVWQKTILDEKLKRLPDTVADLFSPTVADFFCSLGRHWEDGFTAPLAPSGCGARAVHRFLKLHEGARFASSGDCLREQLDLIQDEGIVAFIGPSGAGKTMAALELASAMAENGWRPWHVDMRNADPARLYESIERRVARPSVFVLDDCHLAPDQTHSLVTRVRTARLDRRARVILTVTTTAVADDIAVDGGRISELIEEDIEPQQRIIVRPKVDTFRRIIATARPSLADIPKKTVDRLMATTAGDLFLLDEALRATDGSETDGAATLDAITVGTLQKKVMERYFGERYPSAPTIRRIAAVAQFDVPVPKKAIEVPPDELRDRMLVSIGPPPAWLFAHAALAELIYSALSIAETELDPNQFAVGAIIVHGLRDVPVNQWVEKLTQILRTRLKLVEDRPLKRSLLCDERILNTLHGQGQNIPLETVSLACFLATDGSAPSPYLGLLFDRIKKLLSGATDIPGRDAQMLGMALRTLRLADAERFETVLEGSGPHFYVRSMAACVDLRAAISMLVRILDYVTPAFTDRLIAALDPNTLDALVERTIAEDRSVSTINLALRELGDKDQRYLGAFEAKLGAERMARLIRERANLPATVKILEHVTPAFANRLIAALDANTLDVLVKRTMDEDRSVGTIGVALRELGDRDKEQRQLAAFEAKLGAERMARLIRERADLPATMKILEYVTPTFADGLIAALDADTLDVLVKRTMDEDRSIGTIPFALRELRNRDKEQRQLAAFEAKLGADRMAHLIRERGDLPATMGILRYVTPDFASSLIAALDPDTLDALVNNTINSKAPNIRHLPLSRRFFAHLEMQFSPDTWWRLISGCGDLGALSSILVALGPGARIALLAALGEASSADWATMLGRTNAVGITVFCSDTEPLLNSTARVTFEDVVVAGMNGVVTRSTWRQLAIAHKRFSERQEESRAKTASLDQFKARVAAVNLASPPDFDDLVEAANFIQILWQERPEDRNRVANSILDIAPERNEWPVDHRLLTGARLLVTLAQSEEMPQQTVDRLFEACAHLPEDFDIATCDAKTLFLYLFNIWAVLIARAPGGLGTLTASQDEFFWTGLLDHLDTLARERDNEKKLNLLALVGLLEFTSVFPKEELDRRLLGVIKGFTFLLGVAEKQKAVKRFFAFRGLMMIGPPRLVNDRNRLDRLLDALKTYEVQTPALQLMRDYLSSRRPSKR